MKYDFAKLIDFINSNIKLADHLEAVGVNKDSSNSNSKIISFFSPWSDEKTGSLKVDVRKNTFTDYSANGIGDYGLGNGKLSRSGNIINFVRRHQNLNFAEAVQYIAELYSLDMSSVGFVFSENSGLSSVTYSESQQEIVDVNSASADIWQWNLKTNKNSESGAYHYASKTRGFSDEIIEEFKMGYAQFGSEFPMFDYLVSQKGLNVEHVLEAGIITENDNATFNNMFNERLIIPIHDMYGNIIGFGGRTINDNSVKYINSKESLVFSKNSVLFNIHRAKVEFVKTNDVFIMEGFLDVVSAWQFDIKNAVASMGTAFSLDNLRQLAELTNTQYLCFDSDKAGKKAVSTLMEQVLNSDLNFYSNVRIIIIPNELAKDPDEFIRKFGKDAFLELKNNAVDFLEYLVMTNDELFASTNRTEIDAFLEHYFQTIHKFGLSVSGRFYYLNMVAQKLDLPLGIIDKQYADVNKVDSYINALANIKPAEIIEAMLKEDNLDANTPNINTQTKKVDLQTKKVVENEKNSIDIKELNKENYVYVLNNQIIKSLKSDSEMSDVLKDKCLNPHITMRTIFLKQAFSETKLVSNLYRPDDLWLDLDTDYCKNIFGERNKGLLDFDLLNNNRTILISAAGFKTFSESQFQAKLRERGYGSPKTKLYMRDYSKDIILSAIDTIRRFKNIELKKSLVEDFEFSITSFIDDYMNNDIQFRKLGEVDSNVVKYLLFYTLVNLEKDSKFSVNKHVSDPFIDYFNKYLNSQKTAVNTDAFKLFDQIDATLHYMLRNIADYAIRFERLETLNQNHLNMNKTEELGG